MKRSWNPLIWTGAALVLAGVISYPLFFINYPLTRDFPWANFLLLAAGLILLALGTRRAFAHPDAYRGKISGSVLGLLSGLLAGFFAVQTLYLAKLVPASAAAPRVGDVAPAFTLPDSAGHPVALTALLDSSVDSNRWPVADSAAGKASGVLLIFYRGYW